MYEEITQFIKSEINQYSIESLADHGGRVPAECLQALQASVDTKRSETYKVAKQDAISKRVCDIEADWRREQIKTVAELIGDIPRYSIGTALRGDDDETSEPGISIDKLISDIKKLPRIGMTSTSTSTSPEEKQRDLKVLEEYNNLREELAAKGKAVVFGAAKVKESGDQLKEIRRLLESIKETSIDGEDVSDYFRTYDEKLISNLVEMNYQLEEAIKSSDGSVEKKRRLQEILQEIYD